MSSFTDIRSSHRLHDSNLGGYTIVSTQVQSGGVSIFLGLHIEFNCIYCSDLKTNNFLFFAHELYFYLEIHEIIRKLSLTGILLFIPNDVRSPVALVICMISCINLNYFRPQKNATVFWIAEASFLVSG